MIRDVVGHVTMLRMLNFGLIETYPYRYIRDAPVSKRFRIRYVSDIDSCEHGDELGASVEPPDKLPTKAGLVEHLRSQSGNHD